MSETKKMSAHELMNEMKKYKSFDDKVIQQDGSAKPWGDICRPILAEYSYNYDEYELKKIMNTQIKNVDTAELHIRMRHIRTLLAQIITKSTNYACITLSIAGFNFAYLYVLLSDPLDVEFISLGDSVKSYDGEWRGMTMNKVTFDYIINQYGHVVDKLVGVMKFKQKPKVNIYYNTSLKPNIINSLNDLVNKTQLGIHLLALSWFIASYANKNQDITPMFAKFKSLGGLLNIEATMENSAADDIYTLLGSIFDIRKTIQKNLSIQERSVRTGQKLIQLTPDEASHPLNDSFNVWNEIAVTHNALDLILNQICPGFAIHSFWLMIYETSKFMYNIKDMRARIAQSQTVRLTPADKRTNKILSSKAVCVVNEYCGPTFRFSLTNKSLRENTLQHGSKYMFELMYELFCLHSLLGQFHGDFHCENATVMRLSDTREDGAKCSETGAFDSSANHLDWKIAYIIGEDAIALPHDGSYGCIIDFSRSVAFDNPIWIERIVEKYELYFGKLSDAAFIGFEANVYAGLDESRVLERLKRIASAFDIYEFTHSALTQCKDVLARTQVGQLLESIRTTAKDILMSLEKPIVAEIMPDWSTHVVLKKHWSFGHVDELKSDTGIFRGVYTYNNPMTYSARLYEELPRSIAKNPIIRDPDDEPVDMYSNMASKIKAIYQIRNANIAEIFASTAEKKV